MQNTYHMDNHNFERVNKVGFNGKKVCVGLALKSEIFRSHSLYIRNDPTHVEVESIISKQFSVIKCLTSFIINKMRKNVGLFILFQMLLNPC